MNSQRFLIATHIRPDGDAIGSLCALACILRQLHKAVDSFAQDPIPPNYAFLPEVFSIESHAGDVSSYDMAILVDCGDFERVGHHLGKSIRRIPLLAGIDHHFTCTPFGDVYWNRSSASSTCEMLYDLCRYLPVTMTPELATALYTGMMADTGSFRFSNTTQRVLELAAHLVASGANPATIAQYVYDSWSAQSLRLLAKMLGTLAFHADEQLATAELSQSMFAETGTSPSDSEGFIGFLRSVATVKMALLFREGIDGKVHVSMRSKADIDVAAFAQKRGGGGHKYAAAFDVAGPLTEVRSRCIEEAIRYLQ